MSILYLIRHGQATIGSFNYDNLSDRGKEQAEILGRNFRCRVKDIDRVRYGTMQRHVQTLQGFKSKYNIFPQEESHRHWDEYDHIEIIQRFNPYYRNRWVMLADMVKKLNPRRDFEQMFNKAMDKWLSGHYDDEYNESWPEYKDRTSTALNDLIEDMGESETAMVVTSGGVISSLILKALDLPDSYFMRFNKKLVNCGVTKFVNNKKGLFVSTVNDHSAFEHRPELITYI